MKAAAAGIVLAGGRSSRMGQPKAWLPFAGVTMLERTLAALAAAGCAPRLVVAAPGQELPAVPADVVVLRDPVEGRGPLAGLAVALTHLAEHDQDVPIAFVTACDSPLLSSGFIGEMITRIGSADIAVPADGEHHHPLAAVYRVRTVAPETLALLEADRLRPFFLFERVSTVRVPVEELRRVDPGLDSLCCCNTPEDYEELCRRARSG